MSADIAVEALTLTLGGFRLQKIDFALARGEILVILGPNGAGKSVTLEAIAGFYRPDSGRVLIAGRDVTALPPERRNVGFVVQNFALFPHLTVAQNVAIARRRDRGPGPRGKALPVHNDPAALLAYFGVAHLAQRTPQDLSAGEKQRVALARALAGAPDLFLFDEPFSALDAPTRTQLRDELLSFLRALAIPAIFVTHDHTEAAALADRILVLRDGRVTQNGSAAEVLRTPANTFVARFIGIENILSGSISEISGSRAKIVLGDRTLLAVTPSSSLQTGSAVHLGIRAEEVRLYPPDHVPPAVDDANRLAARVVGLRSLGPLVTAGIDCGFPLRAYLLAPQVRDFKLGTGSPVTVEIAAAAIHLMTE